MNKFKALLLAFLVFGLVACSDDSDDNNPASGNGDDDFSTNATINVQDKGNLNYQYGVAFYDEDSKSTNIMLMNDISDLDEDNTNLENSAFISVDGKTTGTYDASGFDNDLMLGIDGMMHSAESGTVEITKYGDPGGTLQFSIDATVEPYAGTGNPIDIQSGTITVSVFLKSEVFDDEDDDDDGDDDDGDDDDGDDDDDNNNNKDNSGLNPMLNKLILKIVGDNLNSDYISFKSIDAAIAMYDESRDQTSLSVVGTVKMEEDVSVTLSIGFPGKSTGTYETESSEKTVLMITIDGDTYASSGSTINVTEYGNPGSNIKASFSGNMISMNGETFEITEGEISMTRLD